jgi:hypothetical protein
MSEQMKDTLDEVLEKITEVLKKAKEVADLHVKIDRLLEEQDFAVKMSLLNLCLAKTILEESDDFGEAMAYVARISHTLVEAIDKQIEKQQSEGNGESEEDEPEEAGSKH